MYVPEPPTCWEQKVIFYVTTPIQAVVAIAYLFLTPLYVLLAILRLPLIMLTLLMSVVWLPIVGVIFGCGKVSRTFPALRLPSFLVALPFLIFGHILVSLEPLPTPGDQEGKLTKLLLIERFPFFP